MPSLGASGWTGRGKVRARAIAGGAEIAIDGITTQARYYKPLVYEFFRKDFQVRPKGGEFEVELIMEYVGEIPRLDLDNLAKALLDALKGHVFFDDSQIARLLCERIAGERERITVRAVRRGVLEER
ncbi:MAG: RusA family crossover junction endodeoxyribonuclease [Hyphomonadaceae bacterium]|nr:RusA family crossover junction endodeoxyribonuclease [Hyphomonadaceae bacterium]